MTTTTTTRKNPATTKSPTTGKVRGPARKPLPQATNAATAKDASVLAGTRTRKPTGTKATATKAAPKATPAAKATPAKVPASRNLPRDLVSVVVAHYAKASDADKQRIANYLKVVTTGTDENGNRWWPDSTGFPRPTHSSWDA